MAPEDAIDDAISRNVVHFDLTASRARRWTYLALIGLVGVAITVLAWQAVSMLVYEMKGIVYPRPWTP